MPSVNDYRFGYFWNTLPAGTPESNPVLRNYFYDSKLLANYNERLLKSVVKETNINDQFRNRFDTIRDYNPPEFDVFDFDDSDLCIIFTDEDEDIEVLTDKDIISYSII